MSKIKVKFLQYLVLLLLPGFAKGDEEDDEIRAINAKNCTWIAGKYTGDVKNMLANEIYSTPIEEDKAPTIQHKNTYRSQIPTYFDARNHWYQCTNVIDYRRRQGGCSSCWANAAASMISDRICIGSRGNIRKHVSVEDMVTCCRNCTDARDRCKSGYAFRGLQYWIDYGVVTGGNYQESDLDQVGCKPYSRDIYYRNPPDCNRRCRSGYHQSYEEDTIRGQVVYKIYRHDVTGAQRDILYNGPIIAFMTIYKDYRRYKTGIYEHVDGEYEANHFIKVVGWGTEGGKQYWLLANSYGRDWGENGGMFRVVRGKNECSIEQYMRAAKLYRNTHAREWLIYGEPSSVANLNIALGLKYLYPLLLLLRLNYI